MGHGVLVHHSLIPSKQCSEAAKKQMLFLDKLADHSTTEIKMCLWCWKMLKKRALRMVSGLSGSYDEENLKVLKLQSQQTKSSKK